MANRQKLLDAAARVYAEHGFRGATTRRIAEEAGVNEVTLFRLFGSKSALIGEALQMHTGPDEHGVPLLPDAPSDPETELVAWCEATLAHLRDRRMLIRKTMGELEERPEMAPCVSHGPTCAFDQLVRYASHLEAQGDGTATPEDTAAAAAMLMGALFSDAMGRDAMPGVFPHSELAAAAYARLFLRALGCGALAIRRPHRPAGHPRRHVAAEERRPSQTSRSNRTR